MARRRKPVDRLVDYSFLDNEFYQQDEYLTEGRVIEDEPIFSTPEEEPANPLTPEEAMVHLEKEPITSRLDALSSQFSGQRGVMSADADFENLDNLRVYETPEARQKARKEIFSQLGKGSEGRDMYLLGRMAVIDEAEKVFSTPGEFDKRLQAIGSERILSGREAGRAEEYYNRTGNLGTRTVGDVISNAESGLSILGGVGGGAVAGPGGALGGAVVGSAPMAKIAYDGAYTEARLAGVDRQTAQQFATAMSSSEFLLEATGGKLMSAVGVKGVIKDRLKKYLPELVAKKGTKVAGAGALGATAGYAEEAATEALQTLGSLGYAQVTDNPEFKKFLESRAPRNPDGSVDIPETLSQWNRSGLAGAGQGGPIVAGLEYVNETVDQSRRVQEAVLNNTVGNEQARARYRVQMDEAARLSNEMMNEVAPIPTLPIDDVISSHRDLLGELPKAVPQVEGYLGTDINETISQQYRGAGGALDLGTNPLKPLTAAERGVTLEAKIKAMGTIPETPKAPVKPRTKGSVLIEQGRALGPSTSPPGSVQGLVGASKKGKRKAKKEETQEDVLAKIEGLKSERKPEKLGAMTKPAGKIKAVIQKLVQSGTADTEDTLKLINTGKLGIVEKESDLPDGLEKGRDGWYDPGTKRVWLVADNLSQDTLRGTALHEINHFLNRNKKTGKTSTGITHLISGNLDTYNNRIENLAAEGNKVAQRAMDRAKADGNVREELTSYFASEALGVIAKKGVMGRAGQIFKDIKSAINTSARDKGIGELSENDISYILRRQGEDAPRVKFTDGDSSMDSIIGKQAATFEQTKAKFPEREYRGARDNKPRIEISDAKAEIRNLSAIQKQVMDDDETQFRLFDILGHKDLYAAYPGSFMGLQNITVQINPDLGEGEGVYYAKDDTIEIGPETLAKPERLKKILLHEVQHAIQAREEFEGGTDLATSAARIKKDNPGWSEDQVKAQAFKDYQYAYGEAEARLSETNYNLTDEELSDTLPEKRMTEMYWDTKRQATAYRPLDPTKTLRGNRTVQRMEGILKMPGALNSIKAEKGGEISGIFKGGLLMDAVQPIVDWDQPIVKHMERMINNHLQRYAGTEADPLNPLQIFERSLHIDRNDTWEYTMDTAMTPVTFGRIRQAFDELPAHKRDVWNDVINRRIPKQPSDDVILWGGAAFEEQLLQEEEYGYATTSYDAQLRLGDYLNHVKDYLLTVPLEKLQQYDLVRAVRETVAWDAAARKKAEKAKAEADSRLRTYIQFPDGWRWVRLDSPGQFAQESDVMGHSVRGYEPAKKVPMSKRDWIMSANVSEEVYEKYKHISFTKLEGMIMPEYHEYLQTINNDLEALAAGEGGHAHYGYGGWEAIKKDQARIYSLRDPKGKSVVTVELGKNTVRPYNAEDIPVRQDKFEVSQIKGRFNEKPPEETFEKTQDLLRNLHEEELLTLESDIGDFRNAGLFPIGSDYIDYKAMNAADMRDDFLDTINVPRLFETPPKTKRVSSQGLASTRKYSDSSTGVWDSGGMSLVRMLFDPNKGIGKDGLDTREYWRLKSGGLRDLAEGYAVRINRSLKKAGTKKAVFEAAVNKAESQKTVAERERALDGLVRSFGNAGKEYREGRAVIDSLSKEILKDWYNEVKKTGRKVSKNELGIINSIVENVGKYATRVYLANIPTIGKGYAEGIMEEMDKADPNSPHYKKVKDAIEYLLDHEVGIADKTTMMKKSTPTIRRTYQTWISAADNISKEQMVDELLAKKASIPQGEMEAMVRKVVREMLGLDNPESSSPVARYYRGAQLDKGILKKREHVPPVLRKLLGEVTDPAQKILITVSAQADLLYKNRMLNDFYDNFQNKLWVKPGDRAKTGNEKFSEQLSGETYGPLDGMYVTKPFAYAIKAARINTLDVGQAIALAGYDGTLPAQALAAGAARTIGKLSTIQKMSKTVLDPGAWAFNASGSWLALLKNGQVMGTTKASREALGDALTLFLQGLGYEHKTSKETNERLSVLLEHGLPDSVFTAELRDVEKEFYEKLLNELNKGAITNGKQLWNFLKQGMRGLRDNYGLLDSWVKIADFYGQQKYLREYYNANGTPRTTEQINREAADMVKFRNITYSRSPIIVQTLERAGATVFATFAAEVIRTVITTPMTVKMALKKASNAQTSQARNIAMAEATKVGVGYAIAMALVPAFSHMMLNNMFNGEDDDEEAREERERFLQLWFKTDRDQSYVVVGKNKEGGVVLFNASRIDPHGHATDFVRAAAQNDTPEEYWESVKALFTNAAGNGYMDDVKSLLLDQGASRSNLADTSPTTQELFQDFSEWTGNDRDMADRATRVVDNFVPGLARVLNSDKSTVTKGVQVDKDFGNMLSALGMRMTVIDPKEIAGFEANTFNTARAKAVMQWNDLMQREGIDEDDVARTALNVYTMEQDASRRLAEVYSGLDTELAGVNPRKILADANVNPEDINDAALARYRSVVLSRARMQEQEKRQLGQAAESSAKQRLRANYQLARRVIAELNLETR